MDTKQLKERYGWSKDLENQIISLNKQLKEDYTLINAAINAAKTKESWMTYFKKFLVENPALTKDL